MSEKKKSAESKWFAVPRDKFPVDWLSHKDIGHMKWDNHEYVLFSQGFLLRNPSIVQSLKPFQRVITSDRFIPHHLDKPRPMMRRRRSR